MTLPNGPSFFKVQGEVYRYIGAMRHAAARIPLLYMRTRYNTFYTHFWSRTSCCCQLYHQL